MKKCIGGGKKRIFNELLYLFLRYISEVKKIGCDNNHGYFADNKREEYFKL